MININRAHVETLSKQLNSKQTNGINDSILIAPCSSKKYGKGFPEIVDATSADGFSSNTGIQTYSMRWVSKNRVLSIIGKTSSAILDKVDEKMLKLIPGHYKKLSEKEQQMHALNNHIIALEKEISELKAKIKE